MARVCLLVVTDGRDGYLRDALASARTHLTGQVTSVVVVDDSSRTYAARPDTLTGMPWPETNGPPTIIPATPAKRGFAGAVQAGWNRIVDDAAWDFVFHLEDDFTFNERPDLAAMAAILDDNPHLAQVALQRQPVNQQEIAAGGVMALWPHEYSELQDVDRGLRWCEHELFFTTNPSLYRASLPVKHPWPGGEQSEGRYGAVLRAAGYRFAFLGGKTDPPKVHHIGAHRTGTGY